MDRRFLFRKTKERKGGILIILLFISLLLLSFYKIGISMPPEKWGYSFFSYFQNIFFDATKFMTDSIGSIKELRKINEKYEQSLLQIKYYKEIEKEYNDIKAENERLKQQLKFSGELKEKNIPAEIIAKDTVNYYNIFTINKGSKDGVRKDQPVIAFQNGNVGLVGKVDSAGIKTSTVIPVYDSSCYIAARFYQSRYEGLIHGMGSNEEYLLLQHVNKRAIKEISVNDLIVTSGLNSIYPKGIAVGNVLTIKSREYDTSLEIQVEPVINFHNLEYVIVIDREE